MGGSEMCDVLSGGPASTALYFRDCLKRGTIGTKDKNDCCLPLLTVNISETIALVTNGRIGTHQGCMGLGCPHIHNEYPYRQYEQQNQGFMTGLESYSVQTTC